MTTREPTILGPFSGGINTFDDPAALRDNELVEALNFDPGMDGSMKSRPPIQDPSVQFRTQYGNLRMLTWFYTMLPNPPFPAGTLDMYMIVSDGTQTYSYRVLDQSIGVIATFPATDAVQFNGKVWLLAPSSSGSVGGYWEPIGGFVLDANMPTGESIVSYKSRLWIASGASGTNINRVYYSKVLGQANFWVSPGFLDVGAGDGEPVVKLVTYYDTILVFRSQSTYGFTYSSDPATGIVSLLIPQVGLTDRWSLTKFENYLYFLYNGDAYEFINSRATQINVKQPFTPTYNVNPTSFRYAVSYYENRIIFSYTDTMYVFNLRTRTWTTWRTTAYGSIGQISAPYPAPGNTTALPGPQSAVCFPNSILAASTRLRQNFCQNPRLKTSTNFWVASTGATIARITTATGEPTALEVTATATGTVQTRYGTNTSDSIAVSPGQYVTAQGRARTPSATRNGVMVINWYDSSLTFLSTSTGANTSINAAGWTTVASGLTAQAPAGAAYAQCYWRITDAAAIGEKWWLDRVCIEVTNTPYASLPAIFDGDTAGDATYNYEWDNRSAATSGESTSSQTTSRFTKIYYLLEDYVGSSAVESFTCSLTTKTYDFDRPGSFKVLFWWGVDCLFKGTINASVTPVVYVPSVTATADTVTADPSKPTQRFVRFLKKLRFREVFFKVQLPITGQTSDSPVRVFSLSAYLAEKQTVSEKVT